MTNKMNTPGVRSGLFLSCCVVLLVAAHALGLPERPAAPTGWTAVQPAYAAPADGQKLYMTRCMSCHQMQGQGIPGVFPPLDGVDWVTGDKTRLIRVVLHGLAGEIKVKDVTYSGAMPPWGTFLKDDEIAAVTTYIRSSWSNDAEAITTEEVAKVRAADSARKQPWTAAELNKKADSK